MTMATCPVVATTWDMHVVMQTGQRDWSCVAVGPVAQKTGVGRGAQVPANFNPFLNLAWPVSTLLGPKPSEN